MKERYSQYKKSISIVTTVGLMALYTVFVTSCNNTGSTELTSKNKSTMGTKPTYTTLINSFEVPSDKLEESIKYWESCRDFLKTQDGYISTKLHQSIIEGARFQLVNVAIWETPETFKRASLKMQKELGVLPVEGLKPNPSLYDVIRE
jgi:hypothetical protein